MPDGVVAVACELSHQQQGQTHAVHLKLIGLDSVPVAIRTIEQLVFIGVSEELFLVWHSIAWFEEGGRLKVDRRSIILVVHARQLGKS